MPEDCTPATRELLRARGGDIAAAERLLPLVYQELRALAGGFLRSERENHTLQPTALVHEAYLRLIDADSVQMQDRSHFRALASLAMRRILLEHARRRRALKRGAGAHRVALVETPDVSAASVDVVELDDLLQGLRVLDERQHRIVELRFFGGLEVEEVARELGISKSSVEREWRAARAWLGARLHGAQGN